MRRKQSPQSLAGRFLAATPSLLDPNFRRTLLYLTRHDPAAGTVGLILNRPMGGTLGDILPGSAGLAGIPLLEGGPVSVGQVIVARLAWTNRSVHFESLGPEVEAPDTPDPDLRAFAGYAGWSEGQLEEEIREGSWRVLPARRRLLEPVRDKERGVAVWKAMMSGMPPFQRLLSDAPDHPELN